MWRIVVTIIGGTVLFAHAPQAREVDFATLEVRVEGIRPTPGEIGVALFDSPKGYPVHIEHAYEEEWVPLQARQKTVTVVFEGVPFGEYAVSVIHDENGNRTLERSRLGFPEEGVGFSNDQRVKLSAPKFSPAKFPLLEGGQKTIVIQLEYRD